MSAYLLCTALLCWTNNLPSRKPWALTILIFLFVAILSACLVFVFGRIVDIYTKQEVIPIALIYEQNLTRKQRQLDRYVETTVAGDLSADDVQRADQLSKTAYSVSYSNLPLLSLAPLSLTMIELQLHMVVNPIFLGWSTPNGPNVPSPATRTHSARHS
jgi:hypothetical protein